MEVLEALATVGAVGPTGTDVLSQAREALVSAVTDEEHAAAAVVLVARPGPDVPGPIGGAGAEVDKGHSRRRRHVVTAVAAAVVLLGTSAVFLDTTTRSSPHVGRTTPPPRWTFVSDVSPSSWQTPPTSGYQAGLSLICPTASTCYAEDAASATTGPEVVEVTHDAGATWQQSTLPGAVAHPFAGIDCLDGSTCVTFVAGGAGNEVFVATHDGGRTWMSDSGPAQLPSSVSVSDVSCTTPAACVAVGVSASGSSLSGLALVTTDAGASWSESDLPPGFVPYGVRCFADGNCIASGADGTSWVDGAAVMSGDGGRTWQSAAVPAGLGPVESLSCGDASHCLAFATSVTGLAPSALLDTTDGGRTWVSAAATGLPASLMSDAVCVTAASCWVSGALLPSGGTSPAPPAITVGQVQSLLATTDDQGQSWQVVAPAPSLAIGEVMAVSCPQATACFALGYQRAGSGPGSFVFLSYEPA